MTVENQAFGSLTEAFTINMREKDNGSYKNKVTGTEMMSKVVLPDCFNVHYNEKLGRNVSETGTCASIRKEVFLTFWGQTEEAINEIRCEIDRNAIDQLIDFIKNDYNASQTTSSSDLSLISTGVILGGFNSSDQEAFYGSFQKAALGKDIRIARLQSIESLTIKDCLKKLLDQLILEEYKDEKDKEFCDFDIQRLVVNRERELASVSKSKKRPQKLAILIPQFEGFPVLVMEHLLRLLVSCKVLNITVLLGISTNLENIHQALSQASLNLLDTRVFQLKQSKECLDKIVSKIFIDAPSDLKLGHRPFEALYNRFHGRDYSILSFIRGIQFAYMSHFFGNPLSIFLYPDIVYEHLEQEPLHFHYLRSLRSFRVYIERGLEDFGYEDPTAADYKELLEDDASLFEWAKEKIDLVFYHGIRFSVALKALHKMQSYFESKDLKKPIRSLYNVGLKNTLVSDNHVQTCVSLFTVLPDDRKREYLKELMEALNNEKLDEDKEVISEILGLFPEDEESSAEESEEEEDCDEVVAALEDESRKRSMANELNRVKKRRRTKSAKKAGTVLSLETDPVKAKLRKLLTSYFKSALTSYKDLPLHEIVYFEDTGNLITKTFHAEHRGIIENGIRYPKQYLGCDECNTEMSAHLPDITVLFRLYLECGRLINLQDWYDAFKSIYDKQRQADDDEELEHMFQARFSKGIEELRFMGFIRHTGKKTDHKRIFMKVEDAAPLRENLNICKDFDHLLTANRTLSASIANVNDVAVFTSARISREKNTDGSFPQDQKVHLLKWQKLPESRYSFVNSSLGIFSAFQEEWKGAKTSTLQSQLILNVSHKYQQELLRHVRECQGKEASLFSGIHAIWHLAHITCLESRTNVPIGPALSGWMRLNFSAKLKAEFEAIIKLAHPSQDSRFWPLVQMCVLRGYYDASSQLLSHLSQYHQKSGRGTAFVTNPVEAFQQLTQGNKIPKLEDYSSNTAFKLAWEKWNQEASFIYDGGSLSSLKSSILPAHFNQFVDLFGILCGDETLILEKGTTWQDALLGLIQYRFPLYEGRNASDLMGKVKEHFPTSNLLDQIQISLIEKDLGLTLALSLQFDWWLATHLVDLLDKGHYLDSTNLELLNYPGALNVSEWFLMNFSEYLFTCPSLWKASIEYLIYCPSVGRDMLETLIPRISLDSTNKTQKLLLFCSKNNLNQARTTLLRIQGRQALQSKHYSQAIGHYLESNDLHIVSGIVDQLLDLYIKNGDKTYESVVNSLSSSCLFKSARLAFLARYHEFQELYAKQQYQEAANLSILLLTSGSAPKKYWKPLLLDLIPLLEGQIQVFKVDQVMELMRCAENCLVYENSKTYKKDAEGANEFGDAFNIFKLAISRSLAASFVQAAKEL